MKTEKDEPDGHLLSKKAYSQIVDELIAGNIRMGQVIREEDLGSKFGMSRTPIREAILSLESEGIVARNGRYYFVVYPEPDEINQIYELRRELESLAAFLAAVKITEVMKSNLENVIIEMTFLTKNAPEPISLTNVNSKFHGLIAKASGNRFLERDLGLFRLRLRIIKLTILTSYEKKENELRQHRAIADAIIQGDPNLARKKMYSHQTELWNYARLNIIPKLFS